MNNYPQNEEHIGDTHSVTADSLPTKIIHSSKDLDQFHNSSVYNTILGFVTRVNKSVKGKTNSFVCLESQTVLSILEMLEQMKKWVHEIPPLPQRSRFGNKAFCTYYERVEENISMLIQKVLPDPMTVEMTKEEVIEHTKIYLLNCFGDPKRLDYGSGHELNFVMWLLCLEKVGLLTEQDYIAIVTRIFHKYLEVMRHIQVQYWIEPAGSHGVWGLDDYQFLPFLWGSAQLIDHKHLRPKSITNPDVIEGFAKDYMYLRCIQFINQVKTGSFFEHSPLLYDISGAKSWQKVNDGMIKMFKAEVLGKLPIMKHFFFGKLLPLTLIRNAGEDSHKHAKKHAHSHNNNNQQQENSENADECCDDDHEDDEEEETEEIDNPTRPKFRVKSCCVQRIPSAIAARASETGVDLLESI